MGTVQPRVAVGGVGERWPRVARGYGGWLEFYWWSDRVGWFRDLGAVALGNGGGCWGEKELGTICWLWRSRASVGSLGRGEVCRDVLGR
ncbi:hypothetical protein AAC387_Pa02g4561 [Persea americana]